MWLSWMHSPDQISQSETKRQIISKALKAVAEAVVVCCDSDANLFDMSVLRFWRGLIFNDTFRFIFYTEAIRHNLHFDFGRSDLFAESTHTRYLCLMSFVIL